MTSIGRVRWSVRQSRIWPVTTCVCWRLFKAWLSWPSAYGKDDAETIRTNHSLLIMYAPNPTQQSLANEYSEMLGTQTVKSKSTSKGKGSTSTSESDQRRSLLLPQEIKGIGDKKEIVVLNKGSAKPILCQKIPLLRRPELWVQTTLENSFCTSAGRWNLHSVIRRKSEPGIGHRADRRRLKKNCRSQRASRKFQKNLPKRRIQIGVMSKSKTMLKLHFYQIAANRFNLSAIQHAPKLDLSKISRRKK